MMSKRGAFRLTRCLLTLLLSGGAIAGPEAGLTSLAPYQQRLYLDGHRFVSFYASAPLSKGNPQIRRVLVVVHGAGRDADEYFRSAMAAAYLSGALGDTLVVAPRFAAASVECHDDTTENELTWDCDTWKFGEPSSNSVPADSFEVMDELLRRIENPRRFPNESQVLVVGHSAGGQYVVRYAITNKVDETLRVKPQYLALNPSSYPYLDRYRPVRIDQATRPNTVLPVDRVDLTTDLGAARFTEIRDPHGCVGFDVWPYGLTDRRGYSASLTTQDIEQHFINRRLLLVVGQQDSVPLAGLDTSCAAMLQGAHRLERAIHFAAYGRDRYQADHKLVIVPLCGHNARCMLTSPVVMPLLFPRQ